MGDNFPLNENRAYERIRDLMLDMLEEDPERFHALTTRLNELAALPNRTMTLLLDLMDAAPFEVVIPRSVQKNDPGTFGADRETASSVEFLGDHGGIAVELKPTETFDEIRIISISMIEMPRRHPLRKRVNEYRKKRIRRLQKQPIE